MEYRTPHRILQGVPASDGAGVKLTRIIGSPMLEQIDPFLLLDEFKSENRDDYIAGFPPHPHRGFETITYMKQGSFKHQDSVGYEGLLGPGSVQWMTAGRGIIHSEMPAMQDGLLWGFQLWLNLPARLKMIPPHYQDIQAESIPRLENDDYAIVLIAGEFNGTRGAGKSHFPLTYFDVTIKPGGSVEIPSSPNDTACAYVYTGNVAFGSSQSEQPVPAQRFTVLHPGECVRAASDQGGGFLLISAAPINEPIARYGPFVMNTVEELEQAFHDYQNGVLHVI
ncbi:MAG: pirin family protein [Leptospiraceae bacterium]|nr:pirin family protein [Leptospiraceae bacterium]MCB1315290.1 pirin family protein [Leptospiraceae bacterium]MCB1322747.1 pirin family protein [Leptospiraceae bacterium]